MKALHQTRHVVAEDAPLLIALSWPQIEPQHEVMKAGGRSVRMEHCSWTFRVHPAIEMEFKCRATSAGRLWTGFYARIYDTSGGQAKAPPLANNCVVMHVGAPIRATCRLDGLTQRRLSTPGDLDIIPSLCPASWDEDGPSTMMSISFTPSLVRMAAQDMGLDPDHVSIEPHLQHRDAGIEHIGWALKAEVEAAEPLGRLYAESLGTALAARLLERYAPVVPNRVSASFSKRRLRSVIDYIHDNLAQDLSLAELAAIAGLSMSHFKTVFKDATNLPVHQYVIQCRVEHAVSLLSHGKANLSEVASIAGFSDQSHMARCMRRIIGATPAQVRRRRE